MLCGVRPPPGVGGNRHLETVPHGGGGEPSSRGGGGGRQQPAHPQYANYWAPLTRKRHIPPHSAQPRHTNHWAPRTRKRHQQEHRPQRPTERSDPTQHAKGRTGDRPGPRKETTARRNVTQGGGTWRGGGIKCPFGPGETRTLPAATHSWCFLARPQGPPELHSNTRRLRAVAHPPTSPSLGTHARLRRAIRILQKCCSGAGRTPRSATRGAPACSGRSRGGTTSARPAWRR